MQGNSSISTEMSLTFSRERAYNEKKTVLESSLSQQTILD